MSAVFHLYSSILYFIFHIVFHLRHFISYSPFSIIIIFHSWRLVGLANCDLAWCSLRHRRIGVVWVHNVDVVLTLNIGFESCFLCWSDILNGCSTTCLSSKRTTSIDRMTRLAIILSNFG